MVSWRRSAGGGQLAAECWRSVGGALAECLRFRGHRVFEVFNTVSIAPERLRDA